MKTLLPSQRDGEQRVSRLRRGAELVSAHKAKEAECYFNESLRIEDNSKTQRAECYYWLGESKYAQGCQEDALELYSRAIDLSPSNCQFFFDRGYLLSKLKKHKKAVEDFSQCVHLDPQYAWAFFHRGWNYYYLNRFDQALDDFRKAFDLESKRTSLEAPTMHNIKQWLAEVLKALSRVYSKSRDFQRALEAVDEMIQLFPEKTKFMLMKGSILSDMQKYHLALEVYLEAHENDPRNKTVLLNLAYVWYKLKCYGDSIDAYEKALEIDPKCKEAPIGLEKVKCAQHSKVKGDIEKDEGMFTIGEAG